MAYHSTSGPDPSKPAFSAASGPSEQSDNTRRQPHFEADLSELAAKFAASGGPGLSPELSSDLALEIVLHEIVEQSCLATGATGAAIVLERDGLMVCRASSGPTAPELGARLDVGSGLSGECIRARQVQRCDDAQADARADVEASRRLGVRSVVVFPLLYDDKVVGIFEAFSSRPSAFGERDELTLEALKERILKNLQRAAQSSIPQAVEDAAPNTDVAQEFGKAALAENSRRGLDIVTWALGAVVLACAVWLGMRVVQRFWPSRANVRASVKHKSAGAVNEPVHGTDPALRSEPASTPAAVVGAGAVKGPTGASGAARTNESLAPEGTLLIYKNGKEVFRMPPSPGQVEGSTVAGESQIQRASSIQAEKVVELTPAAAEDSLIHRVEPEYPEKARQEQIQGAVVLEVRIHPDGAVDELKVASGQPLLADAAVAAVKQWRFKPHRVNGEPAEMQTTITLNFRLPQ